MTNKNPGLALNKFCQLPTPSYEQIYADANRILDDIISQCHTYRKSNQQVVDSNDIVQFISHGCEILENATILLRSKFVQVVNINLPFVKNSLDERCVNNLVTFLCQTLSNSKSPLVLEFLKALALTLAGNGSLLTEENLLLLLAEDGTIWMYMDHQDWIIKGYALQCLGNICIRSASKEVVGKEYVKLCYTKLLDSLRIFLSGNLDDIECYKLINIALKALQNVLFCVMIGDDIVEPEFAIALLQVFLAFGSQNYPNNIKKLVKVLPSRKAEDIESLEKIYPTKRKEKSPMTKKVHVKKNRRRKKKNINVNLEESFDVVSEDGLSNSYNNLNWRQPAVQQQTSSSESEFSDSEAGHQDQLNSVLSKVRQNAAITIQDILRCCDRRSKFACWLRLVPESISNDHPSLLCSLATEHSPKIRASILLALMELIDGSKGFLDSAVNTDSRSTAVSRSFTPFSIKLGQSLNILHDTLLTTLDREQTDAAKDRVVKCLTLLMLNSPYRKITVDYLPDIVAVVSKHILVEDGSLCQSVITCLAASMSAQPDNYGVLCLLSQTEVPTKSHILPSTKTAVENEEIKEVQSWIVSHCLKELVSASKDNIRELRLASEYIQLVTVILRCHPNLITKSDRSKFIDMLVNVFMFSTDPTLSIHAIQLLEEFSKYYAMNFEKMNDDTEGCLFWKKMLSIAMPHYLNVEPEKPIKCQAAICDWLSNMGSHYFAVMKNPEQIFIKTVLIGLAASNEAILAVSLKRATGKGTSQNVDVKNLVQFVLMKKPFVTFLRTKVLSKDVDAKFQAAAVRALGVIIDYPCMRDDVWFVVDVTRSILNQLNNPSVSIRLKAAWSLANLCDFIGKNGFLTREYPETLILSILQYATKAALDNEKVRILTLGKTNLLLLRSSGKKVDVKVQVTSNGVRALGNILKFLPKELYNKPSFQDSIQNAVEALIKNILTGSMKTRWNACYACRYMFENPDCPVGNAPWTENGTSQDVDVKKQENLYNSLLEALRECKNFKVRTSSASALCSPLSRSCYGSEKLFSFVWLECLIALEKSEELTDFTEFKHKDTLQDQTTTLLLHLLSVATESDLKVIRLDVQKYQRIFLLHCERCVKKVEINEENIGFLNTTTDKDDAESLAESVKSTLTISTTEDDKFKELRKTVESMRKNLCREANIDNTLSTLHIIKTALFLLT